MKKKLLKLKRLGAFFLLITCTELRDGSFAFSGQKAPCFTLDKTLLQCSWK